MMQFFRKHQKFFFIVMTVIIVISFSFFGTFNSMASQEAPDQPAFKSISGKTVMRSQLDQMTRFISTDAYDKLIFGGIWGPNFLNDGVIRKDFLENHLAATIASPFFDSLRSELEPRLDRERRYVPYTHPQMPFLSAEAVWGYFVPSLKESLAVIKKSDGRLDDRTFNAQVNLFLQERLFPSQYLKEVLRQQQKQLSWIEPDPALAQKDLSLFGYHTLQDWFGLKFIELAGQVIMNGAAIAESRGYTVSKEEALADLLLQSEKSFKEQQKIQNPNLGVKNSQEYFTQQLRFLGMDQAAAVNCWRQVLLFRRLMSSVGDAVFIDPLMYNNFVGYAGEKAKVGIYQLPPALHMSHPKSLEHFQTYLNAVAIGDERQLSVELPSQYKPIAEIKKHAPELLQKRYVLEVAETHVNEIGLRVPLRETRSWELDHWDGLVDHFPELGTRPVSTHQERFAVLEGLELSTRKKIDEYARMLIVKEHPEWIQEALSHAPAVKKQLGIHLGQTALPLRGVHDVEAFQRLLDQEDTEKLLNWSGDQQTYYKIRVLERSPNWEILTFDEAEKNKLLEPLLNKTLEKEYSKIREANKESFMTDEGSWKSFTAVKDLVTDLYFQPLYQLIQKTAADYGIEFESGKQSLKEFCDSYRFIAYMKDQQKEIQNNPVEDFNSEEENGLSIENVADQWKLQRGVKELTRDSKELDSRKVFEMAEGQWSSVETSADGNLFFFQLISKTQSPEFLRGQMQEGQRILGNEAKKIFMAKIMKEILEKKAVNIDLPAETNEPSSMDGGASQ